MKLTHWGIVAAVIGNALITQEGSGWHIWIGYGLATLLVLRLLWGFVGPAEARFSAFPFSPGRALQHLGEIRRGEVVEHKSHNPLTKVYAKAGVSNQSGLLSLFFEDLLDIELLLSSDGMSKRNSLAIPGKQASRL